jgi:flagellar protein FliS
MYARAANAYRTVHLTSASPAQVLLDSFARLVRDIGDARDAIGRADAAAKGKAIGHALALIAALQAALDAEAAPELCRELTRLYGFVETKLTEASVRMHAGALDEAERVVRVLEEGFAQAAAGAPPAVTAPRTR